MDQRVLFLRQVDEQQTGQLANWLDNTSVDFTKSEP